ncbi:L,D-transpeptidase family protein [Brevibacillus ruminantium]|uniref:L,D-transpeptidase family protein n=1 Tax=Brevibacillus ruminantium TaxID=2950604 RepID=A0ABY4WLB6_9BACL|nr:L,D-transpeptidase family protein [Brevibacillus ruminantium]USG67833.1 L,D-transpeptidase family protein [Brevibacillus ruminantium]
MKWLFSLIVVGMIAITASQAPAHADKEIYINLWKRTLELKENGKVIKTYRIGVGTRDTPSPVGVFEIVDKRKNWFDGFGPRWMQLNVGWGTFGIHGTDKPYSIGGFVSEGCIRMFDNQVEELYDLVSVGTKVTIDGPLTGHPDITYRILVKGSRSALVQIVQNRLQAAGYYMGECNGQFDRLTKSRLPSTKKIMASRLHPKSIMKICFTWE